ncbi:TetR/AcrR family transcriptional regulator [Sneathiella glossodoripedis]|uniref:TetR/AcrR family transcriptional regulator n=1 Tax=Sneathiella glossodoripedis TaxID=418853 RepID=UPI000470A2C1|nr:TetR/AcrR family transcriptional regulator [Sneathiella glossodoripedis]
MRYDKGHKDQTREHILKISTEQFLEQGYNAVGIAKLMASAGLTNGAFYNHFKSKEDLFEWCVVRSLQNIRKLMEKNATKEGGGLRAIILDYLGDGHFSNPARGCAAATLTPEISRLGISVKTAFTREQDAIVEVLVSQLPHTFSGAKRREVAQALFAMMTGTLQLARAMPTKEAANAVLVSGQKSAFDLCQIKYDP